MEIKKLIEELEKFQINEMALHYVAKTFPVFRKWVLQRWKYKIARAKLMKINKQKALYEYPELPFEKKTAAIKVRDLDITENAIEHTTKRHPNLTDKDWEDFLKVFSTEKDVKILARKQGRNGQRYLFQTNSGDAYFGYVVDIFKNARSQLVTMFKDKKANIENWIKNEI